MGWAAQLGLLVVASQSLLRVSLDPLELLFEMAPRSAASSSPASGMILSCTTEGAARPKSPVGRWQAASARHTAASPAKRRSARRRPAELPILPVFTPGAFPVAEPESIDARTRGPPRHIQGRLPSERAARLPIRAKLRTILSFAPDSGRKIKRITFHAHAWKDHDLGLMTGSIRCATTACAIETTG